MLTINSLRNFYYVPSVTDMRCGYHRLMQIVKHQFHRDPYSGDVFLFMSKDRTKVKIVVNVLYSALTRVHNDITFAASTLNNKSYAKRKSKLRRSVRPVSIVQ